MWGRQVGDADGVEGDCSGGVEGRGEAFEGCADSGRWRRIGRGVLQTGL